MIADDTPLIPELVAERVVQEELPGAPNPRPMIRYLCRRAERHYASLPKFRKMLRRKDAPDCLEAFMVHWTRAVVKARASRIPSITRSVRSITGTLRREHDLLTK